MTSNRAEETPQLLAEFTVASEPGNERVALREVAAAAADCGLTRRSDGATQDRSR